MPFTDPIADGPTIQKTNTVRFIYTDIKLQPNEEYRKHLQTVSTLQ